MASSLLAFWACARYTRPRLLSVAAYDRCFSPTIALYLNSRHNTGEEETTAEHSASVHGPHPGSRPDSMPVTWSRPPALSTYLWSACEYQSEASSRRPIIL